MLNFRAFRFPESIQWYDTKNEVFKNKFGRTLFADLRSRDTRALTRIFRWSNVNTPKNPHLMKPPQKILAKISYHTKTLNGKFQTPKNLRSSLSIEIRSTSPPPLLPGPYTSKPRDGKRPSRIKSILNEDVGALTDAAENHNTERSRIFFNSQKDSNRYFIFLEKFKGLTLEKLLEFWQKGREIMQFTRNELIAHTTNVSL